MQNSPRFVTQNIYYSITSTQCRGFKDVYLLSNVKRQRFYLENVGKKLGVKKLDDWYQVKLTDVQSMGGAYFIKECYGDNLTKALKNVFPEHNWKEWKFLRVPDSFWVTTSNQKDFIQYLGEQLKVEKMEDWYRCTHSDFVENNGHGLMRIYGGYKNTLRKLLNFDFKEWKFGAVPSPFWKDIKNQREFMQDLGEKLGVKEIKDWYKVTKQDITKNGGVGLLLYYKSDLLALMNALFPEMHWQLWKFNGPVTTGYWADPKNAREFIEDSAKQLNFQTFEDYYQFTAENIRKFGGQGLLDRSNESPCKLLQFAIPEYEWKPWKFTQSPRGFWNSDLNANDAFTTLEKDLNIRHPDDWLHITRTQMNSHGAAGLIKRFGGVSSMLQHYYPHHNWDFNVKLYPSRVQGVLFKTLSELFPGPDIHLSYPHPGLRFSDTDAFMELDVYIPDLNIAFEYQGEQHYRSAHYYSPSKEVKKRDEEKKLQCEKMGITLISIPFWWDQQKKTLAATIHKYRPDLISDPGNSPPISEEILPHRIKEEDAVYRKGNSVIPINLQLNLATKWENNIDPTDWWMSEQLDGIRLLWDGSGQFFLRSGKEVQHVPDFIKTKLPVQITVEIELTFETDSFNRASKLVTASEPNPDEWENAVLYCFDLPSQVHMKYEERLNMLQGLIVDSKHVKMVEYQKCLNRDHLQEYFNEIIKKGGEGVIIRARDSYYFQDKSLFYLKSRDDTDALVSKIEKNLVFLQLADGKTFSAPNENLSLNIGDVVTVRFSKLNSSEIPEDPILWKFRRDLTWKDVMDRHKEKEYTLSTGYQAGGVPKCRGCGKRFSKRDELRIHVQGVFSPQTVPRIARVSFCVDYACVEKAMYMDQYKKRGTMVIYPRFKGKVRVPLEISKERAKEITDISLIEWVYD